MNQSRVTDGLPNSLRWFLSQGLHHFMPWHLLESDEQFIDASEAFEREDIEKRKVFVFASRQDCDDFAGLEIIDGNITDKVIYFHPSFSTTATADNLDIVNGVFDDVFDFVSQQVIPDMKEWALTEDASELEHD